MQTHWSCRKCFRVVDARLMKCAACGTAKHAVDCRLMLAIVSPVGIECPHGRDVCPICDACTCAIDTGAAGLSGLLSERDSFAYRMRQRRAGRA